MERVKGYNLEPGDRILGTDLVVESVAYHSTGDVGSERDRQRYEIRYRDGRTMIVTADYTASVLR
jgi:hypothetical protein